MWLRAGLQEGRVKWQVFEVRRLLDAETGGLYDIGIRRDRVRLAATRDTSQKGLAIEVELLSSHPGVRKGNYGVGRAQRAAHRSGRGGGRRRGQPIGSD